MIQALERNGAAVLSEAESVRFHETFVVDGHFDTRIVGQAAAMLAPATAEG